MKNIEKTLQNILAFWTDKMTDQEHCGFYGRRDGNGRLYPTADKGAVLNARILWSFAAAYRVLKRKEYRDAAMRTKRYFIDHFIDKEYGGVYWSVDYMGRPRDTKKQTYAIGFAIYGLSELYRATGDEEALLWAQQLYKDIEQHTFDAYNTGYVEALTREWRPIDDMRLSEKDMNASRTMNTHLHIMEPYTNLLRMWNDEELAERLHTLLHIFTKKLFNTETHHLGLFFDDAWKPLDKGIESYGHDIEASWLLDEAAAVLGCRPTNESLLIGMAAADGLQDDGSMIHEACPATGTIDNDRVWWVQCENIIGQYNLFQRTGDDRYRQYAERCWDYTCQHLIDTVEGEWFWSIRGDGTVNRNDDKAGPWKCPYHNTRLCIEMMERIGNK